MEKLQRTILVIMLTIIASDIGANTYMSQNYEYEIFINGKKEIISWSSCSEDNMTCTIDNETFKVDSMKKIKKGSK